MAFLTKAANRGSIATGYDIENSLKLEKSNNEHLYRAIADGNRKTWTFSCWIKRTELQQTNSQVLIHFGVNHHVTRMFIDDTNDQIYLDVCNTENELYRSITNRRFRDTSAWYHIVWRMDTTQGTAANRMRLYINGVEETSWAQHQIPPQNYETLANTTAGGYDDMGIGTFVWAGSSYDGLFSGYLAQVAHVDGQSYAPTEFGEFDEDSDIWKPKDVSDLNYGTGNNSFFLDFETASDLGANAKGNDVNFSLNNITSANQATDTPTNNFATTNPILRYFTETFTTEGATVVTKNANGWIAPQSTICPASGKWYMEFKFNALDSRMVGAAPIGGTLWNSANHYGGTSGSDSVGYADTGYLYVNDSGTTYGPSYDNSNIIAVALDMDNGYIYWAKDNTWINSADPVAGSGGYALPAGLVEHSIGASVYQQAKQSFANFGGYTTISISSAATDANGYGTFEYAPPSGYYALCTKNLAEYG